MKAKRKDTELYYWPWAEGKTTKEEITNAIISSLIIVAAFITLILI